MASLPIDETNVQGSVMVTFLHQKLAEAIKRIAELEGDKAVLEYRLAKAMTPNAPQ